VRPRPAGHEVLPLPPQPRRLVEGNRCRHNHRDGNRAAHPGQCAAPRTSRRRGRRNDPRQERQTTAQPAPRSSANDRPPDAPQTRRPSLLRARTGQGQRRLRAARRRCHPRVPRQLDSSARPTAGRQTQPEHPGTLRLRDPRAAPPPSTALTDATSPPWAHPRHNQLDPRGQRRPHIPGVSTPTNARFR
jgi:hypothetical protein